jgi:hypothetical protein
LVAAFLLFKPLLERLHQLIEATHGLDFGLFGVAEVLFGQFFEPFGWDINGIQHGLVRDCIKSFEGRCKGAVKFIEMPLVLDPCCAGQEIEGFDVISGQSGFHPFKKRQKLAHGYWNPLRA